MEKLIKLCEEASSFEELHERYSSSELFEIIPLKQAASSRSYFRLKEKNGSNSLVIMKLPADSIPVEEGFTGKKIELTEYPFVTVLKACRNNNIPVPDLYKSLLQKNMLLLQDLGDVSLFDVLNSQGIEKTSPYYFQAVIKLADFQLRLNDDTGYKKTTLYSRVFDNDLYTWEFEHFIEYGLQQHECYLDKKLVIKDSVLKELRLCFEQISKTLSKEPKFINHRDYHSMNLMVFKEKLYMIDFQDALKAPLHYDLASLLRDSYTMLPEELIEQVMDNYINYIYDQRKTKIFKNIFKDNFHLSGFQRNLKAWGRFHFIDKVKGNPSFLEHIPNTIKQIKRFAGKHVLTERCDRLLKSISPEYANIII